jgi:hypothetical protein
MEQAFKVIFFLAIIVFIITVIGLFILVIKILLLFNSEIDIMGLIITKQIQ